MFGLRFTTDCHPRVKNGHPAHRTMGIDSTSSTQLCTVMSIHWKRWPNMARTKTMPVSGKVHQKRR